MGILKTLALMSGVPVRPTTTRERARKYQRQANALAAQEVALLEQQVAAQEAATARIAALSEPAVGSPPVAGSQQSPSAATLRLEKLEKLGQLRASGVLTEDEFQAQKKLVLESDV